MKNIVLMVWCLVTAVSSLACDVCGSNTGLGINLIDNHTDNYISLGYNTSYFGKRDPAIRAVDDEFSTFSLMGRFRIGSRIKVTTFVPYAYNVRNIGESSTTSMGLSDIRLHAMYRLLKTIKDDMIITTEIGLGMVLPSGKYDSNIFKTNLPDNFNPGRGSWGNSFHANAYLEYNDWNVTCISSVALYYRNRSAYRFGSQTNINVNTSRVITLGSTNITPAVMLTYEHTARDRHANNRYVHGTGGTAFLATPNISVVISRLVFSASYSLPIHSDYGDGEVVNNGRIGTQITYVF